MLATKRHAISRLVGSAPVLIRRFASGAIGTDSIEHNGHKYLYAWLRDSCQCPKCIHPSTRQKLHRTSDVELNIRPIGADGVTVSPKGIRVQWSEDHTSFYPTEFLSRYSTTSNTRAFHRDVDTVPWDHSQLTASQNLFVSYESLHHPSGLLDAIIQLQKYGLLFVRGVSNAETSNETCEARLLAERFSELRETFYGKLWDVINVKNSTNIAYTNLHLGLHMDLLYV